MHLLPDSGLSPEHPSPSFLPTPAHSPAPLHVEPLEWGGHVGLRSFTDMQYSLLRDPQPQSTPSREMEAIVPPSYSPLSPLHSMEDLPAASILSSLCSGPLRQASVGGREGGREGETRKIIYVPAGEAEGGRLGLQAWITLRPRAASMHSHSPPDTDPSRQIHKGRGHGSHRLLRKRTRTRETPAVH